MSSENGWKSRGVSMIAAERVRQMEAEGYTPEHDDEHAAGEIAWAAVCYAAPGRVFDKAEGRYGVMFRDPWPWEPRHDKRGQRREGESGNAARIRELVKAGALIAAEIDRLVRLEEKPLDHCAANNDGECDHAKCPQRRDGEPKRSGRTCPLWRGRDND